MIVSATRKIHRSASLAVLGTSVTLRAGVSSYHSLIFNSLSSEYQNFLADSPIYLLGGFWLANKLKFMGSYKLNLWDFQNVNFKVRRLSTNIRKYNFVIKEGAFCIASLRRSKSTFYLPIYIIYNIPYVLNLRKL
jgi:hypothetical protein